MHFCANIRANTVSSAVGLHGLGSDTPRKLMVCCHPEGLPAGFVACIHAPLLTFLVTQIADAWFPYCVHCLGIHHFGPQPTVPVLHGVYKLSVLQASIFEVNLHT